MSIDTKKKQETMDRQRVVLMHAVWIRGEPDKTYSKFSPD